MMQTECGDGVAGFKQRHRDLSSNGVMDLMKASGRSRLKPALEDSTWRRRHDYNMTLSLTEEEGWNRIEEYVQYQDDLWDDPLSPECLKMACKRISYLETSARKVGLKNPYLICDYYGGSHEAEECSQNNPAEQVCLSGGDIYDDPSLLIKIPKQEAPTFAITTRSGVSTQDPLFPAPSQSTPTDHAEGATEKEGPKGAESSIMQDEEAPRSSILYQPSRSSNLPFPSRVKKQKKDDEDE
ncbi:hypothetical protein Tco_0511764 [Tanacetum coccineum]